MDFKQLVTASRSIRRFDQSRPVSEEVLCELVDMARLTPSGRNSQPLRYAVCSGPEMCDAIFPLLGWAGYLKDWRGPEPGEQPTGYVVVMLDSDVQNSPGCDHGIAAQTIMLGAAHQGLGGCMVGTVNRRKLTELLELPDNLEILLVLALGVPAEEIILESLPLDGKIEYWRDETGRHHVPKRSLEDILVIRRSR